jgi:hypothetical protein
MIYHTQSEHATPITPPMQWINLEYTSVILNRCLNLYQYKIRQEQFFDVQPEHLCKYFFLENFCNVIWKLNPESNIEIT